MKLKTSSAFLTLVDLQGDDDESDDDDIDFMAHNDSSMHSHATMDSSVYSETELIQRQPGIDHFTNRTIFR